MDRKLFGKLNIIDLIIIGVVLISLFAAIFRMVSGSDEDKSVYTLTYICREAPAELLWEIKKADPCADGDSGTELGSVSDVQIIPSDAEGGNPSGIITSQVEGYRADHGIAINDTVYLKGSRVNLIVGDSIFEVYISDIN